MSDFGLDNFQFKLPERPHVEMMEPPNLEIPDMPQWYMWSDTQFEIIKDYIETFEASLDQEHEVGLMLTNFGQSVLMQVTEVGYEKSVLMVFKGTVNGNQATLIQHINQLSFLLTAVPRTEPEKPKQKIGFIVRDHD